MSEFEWVCHISGIDPELDAITVCLAAISRLDGAERSRVLAYLSDRVKQENADR